MSTGRLEGRIAAVTGAAQGIGAGIARRLAKEGAAVLITDINFELAAELADDIRSHGGAAAPGLVDVADRDSVFGIPNLVETSFGAPLDLFVTNAGVQTFRHALEVPAEDWDRIMDINARGVMFGMQMAGLSMTAGGSVVAVASIQARLGSVYYPHYSASKASVISLVHSFALTLAPKGVRVNAVAPGIIDTALWDAADREICKLRGVDPGSARKERIAANPLGRAGTPEDVAASVSFLSSEDASYITGETIYVCGGDVML